MVVSVKAEGRKEDIPEQGGPTLTVEIPESEEQDRHDPESEERIHPYFLAVANLERRKGEEEKRQQGRRAVE
jgi:hypothetical protein